MALQGIHALGVRAKAAARLVGASSAVVRNEALMVASDVLMSELSRILEANASDVERARASGMDATALDRLRLSQERLEAMASGLRTVAGLADPVGEVVDGWVQPNGLRIERVRVPLGVVGVIYENRPNVTSDAAGLCLKAGNAALLRGSSSAQQTNSALVDVLRRGLTKVGLPEDGIQLVEDSSHAAAVEFMRLRGLIDCLIPRGGPALISSLLEHATVPYVLDGDGNCHVYVDVDADLTMARKIVANAKMQRPGVCNAVETLLVHSEIAAEFLPVLRSEMENVEWVGDDRVRLLVDDVGEATEEDFATEFLSLKLSVAVVDDVSGALEHVARFGTGHSEAIVTNNLTTADLFVRSVDAAAVVVNASTRFVDGGELGLGAEVGISTQKLHARGPMGVRELTCVKWVVRGEGHVR